MKQKERPNCDSYIIEGKEVLDSLIHKLGSTNIRSLDKEIISRSSAKLQKVLDPNAAQIDFPVSELENLNADEKRKLLQEKGFLGHIFYAELVIEAFIDIYNGKGKSRGYLGNRSEIYKGSQKEFSLLKDTAESMDKVLDNIFLSYNCLYTPNERKEEYNLMINNILNRSIRTKLEASKIISKENSAPERYKKDVVLLEHTFDSVKREVEVKNYEGAAKRITETLRKISDAHIDKHYTHDSHYRKNLLDTLMSFHMLNIGLYETHRLKMIH